MRGLVAGLALVVVCGCGSGGRPIPTPGSIDDVIAELVLRGVTVHELVSGDSGCPTSDLHDNAVHMEVALGPQSTVHDVYLFRWRRQADFDRASAPFGECVAEYEAQHPAVSIERLELSPWRAYGTSWSEAFRNIVDESLRSAGGG